VSILSVVYLVAVSTGALYGANALLLAALYVRRRGRRQPAVEPETWPVVTVQLPIFNELYVVERLIDAVARLDYPRDRLQVQVVDDSTDETVGLAEADVARSGRMARYRAGAPGGAQRVQGGRWPTRCKGAGRADRRV